MRLTFRQGIVRHQIDSFGTQTFLDVTGSNVSFSATNEPTILTFAHGQKDYLYTERLSQPDAWGPFAPFTDYWLYWQLNPVTGEREFGFTDIEPVVSANPPVSPGTGQMWFNSTIQYGMSGVDLLGLK